MKLNELQDKLKAIGVQEDAYCLTGGLPHEAYCISATNSIWEVYYSERGEKSSLKIFPTEDEAGDYFYSDIIKDKTVF